jgi:predicted permease
MYQVIGLVIPFFGMILIGAVAARTVRGQPLEALGWLNVFVVYVALPALFFQLLARTPVERLSDWRFILGAVASTYIIFILVFAWSMLVQRSGTRDSAIKALASCYGNIGYMAPGMALLAFGEEAAVPIALIFCFENIVHFAVLPMLMAVSGPDRKPLAAMLAGVLKQVVLHPFMIATALGVIAAVLSLRLPLPLDRLLQSLSGAAAPCALFAMGVSLALRPLKRIPSEIGLIAGAKLILHPAICYVVLSAAGNFDPVWMSTAVLMAALPTATNVFVVAQQYGVWEQRASATVLLTTVASVLTLTGLLYGLTSGLLPPDLFP